MDRAGLIRPANALLAIVHRFPMHPWGWTRPGCNFRSDCMMGALPHPLERTGCHHDSTDEQDSQRHIPGAGREPLDDLDCQRAKGQATYCEKRPEKRTEGSGEMASAFRHELPLSSC